MLSNIDILAFVEGMSVCGALENYLRGIEFAEKNFKADTALKLYRTIEKQVAVLKEMLMEVQQISRAASPSFYDNFYRHQKSLCDIQPVKARYEDWKRDVGGLNFDLLKDKQTLEVEEFLRRKILRFTQAPSEREIKKVDLDKVRLHLPYGYELPDGFERCCARFRRFIVWDDDILKIDYGIYGNYLFQYYYDLSVEERRAFVEFDIMLDLIHKDMMSLKEVVLPEPLATPDGRLLLEKARNAGYLDAHYQPKLSNTKSAMLADEIAARLQIRNRWKVFEQFWNRHDMYKDNYEGRDQKQSSSFLDKIRTVLG